jgi:hypothetical protein
MVMGLVLTPSPPPPPFPSPIKLVSFETHVALLYILGTPGVESLLDIATLALKGWVRKLILSRPAQVYRFNF